MLKPSHELDEQKASKLLNTVRLLLPVASKEDACYFEEHGSFLCDRAAFHVFMMASGADARPFTKMNYDDFCPLSLEASIGADVWGVAAKSTSWFMFSPPSYSPSESSDPLEKSLLQFFSLQSRLLVHCGNFNLNHESMPWARHAGFGQDLLRRILNHKERQGQPHPQPLR
ncbi:unnamed protein product, partial [Cladocopium goreaui]